MKRLANLTKALVTALLLGSAGFAHAQGDAITREDKEFLKNAAEMGVTEVELGKLAQARGGSPEVKALGAKLVADHEKSNAELIALAKKKGVELKAEPASSQKQMLGAFEKKSGAEFDKEFHEHVAKDHEKAIKAYTDAAADAKDADVKSFAQKHLSALKEHHQEAAGKR